MRRKTLAYVVYPGISLLEQGANRTLLGGMLVQSSLLKLQAGYEVVAVGERIEEMATDTPLALIPQKTFADLPEPDALVVGLAFLERKGHHNDECDTSWGPAFTSR